jgi:hypothetical protein
MCTADADTDYISITVAGKSVTLSTGDAALIDIATTLIGGLWRMFVTSGLMSQALRFS